MISTYHPLTKPFGGAFKLAILIHIVLIVNLTLD